MASYAALLLNWEGRDRSGSLAFSYIHLQNKRHWESLSFVCSGWNRKSSFLFFKKNEAFSTSIYTLKWKFGNFCTAEYENYIVCNIQREKCYRVVGFFLGYDWYGVSHTEWYGNQGTVLGGNVHAPSHSLFPAKWPMIGISLVVILIDPYISNFQPVVVGNYKHYLY